MRLRLSNIASLRIFNTSDLKSTQQLWTAEVPKAMLPKTSVLCAKLFNCDFTSMASLPRLDHCSTIPVSLSKLPAEGTCRTTCQHLPTAWSHPYMIIGPEDTPAGPTNVLTSSLDTLLLQGLRGPRRIPSLQLGRRDLPVNQIQEEPGILRGDPGSLSRIILIDPVEKHGKELLTSAVFVR